ncbi:MAG: NAD(P)-dependent oxidoreductase [Spirochaetia bacterium]
MALAHALAGLREVVDADRSMRNGSEQFLKQEVRTLYGARVGIIGYGNLAQSLHPLLAPFRCALQAYDPWLPGSYLVDRGVAAADLDTLLGSSDVIFVLAAPTPENRAMLSRDKLEKVKEGAVVVLVSRAHVVDFDALLDLAEEGKFTATIDVYPEEPPPAEHRVRRSVNTILTPHLAGASIHARRNIGRLLLKDIEAMNSGLPPMCMRIAQPGSKM